MTKPIILQQGEYNKKDIDDLRATHKIWEFQDIYLSQLTELWETQNAGLVGTKAGDDSLASFIASKGELSLSGSYVYYPWSGVLLHILPKEDLQKLRTNRTRLLVTQEEQKKLGDFTASVAGLSFGNGIALSLVYGGASNTIKIADTDIFETTNLNRVRVGLTSVGVPKTHVTARQIYEINPYADVQVHEEGVTESTIENFVFGSPKTNIIFDVVDDLGMKIKLRLAAKKAGVPVVMLTSLEDSVLVDVERYDLDPDASIFHGLLGSLPEELLDTEMTEQDKAKYAMAIVGKENISYRNLQSLFEVGDNLVSRPHLFSTVSIVCGFAGFILRRIALGEDMPSMRKLVSFNEILSIAPNSHDTQKSRDEMFQKIISKKG